MFDFAKKCWFLTGPTASGKTQIALELARLLNAEIISMDSMAIYRAMDIGTAKPTLEQRAEVAHHLIDIRNPNETFSVSDYLEAAEQVASEIQTRSKEVLVVGGTPLYLKAMLRGLFDGPPEDPEFRIEVRKELDRVGVEALHARLQQVDPLSAAKLHPNDVRRIIRALEVYRATGQPISHMQLEFDDAHSADECRVFALDWPRPAIHERIEKRVDAMFEEGFVDEVEGLTEQYGAFSKTASQAVGYKEILEFLRGEHKSLEETIELTKTRTRQFAKRQETWFRSLTECRRVRRDSSQTAVQVAEEILKTARDQKI